MELSPEARAFLQGNIRRGVVLLYVIWVLIGWCWLRHTAVDASHLQYVALRTLPAGHRLLDQDFRFDPSIPLGERNRLPVGTDPAGKYLTTKCQAHDTFKQEEVSSSSPIHAAKDMVEYLFPLEKQPDLVSVLDSDSRVDVCAGTCVLQSVRVLSVVCSSTTPPECFVTLELSPDDSKKITGEIKNYRLIVR